VDTAWTQQRRRLAT